MRTLILIPAMYSEKDLKKILKIIPEDFEETSEEFWRYVDDKLTPLEGRVCAVYSDKPKEDDRVKTESLVRKLSESTRNFYLIDDSLLTAESEEWLALSKDGQNQTALEFYEESMRDRDRYVISIVDKTLEDDGIGVLVVEPTRKISFPENIRVIKLCPFDPTDYVNRHLVKIKIEKKRDT